MKMKKVFLISVTTLILTVAIIYINAGWCTSMSTTGTELLQAIKIAEEAIVKKNIKLSEHKIIKAENVLKKSPKFWFITFKKKSLIPAAENQIIGAGGEIFVAVDLSKNTVKITYGE